MLKKMSFETAKKRFMQMSVGEKRGQYKQKDYVHLSHVSPFANFGPRIKKDYPKTFERVHLWQGDITKLEIDAIVNAANKQLAPGGGVCGYIHSGAGRDLAAECQSLGGCATGNAVITGGYRLPAKYVIHAVGPMGEKPQLLTDTYKSILKVCQENGISSVAIPCISTGIYGYPVDRAANIAVNTVLENLPDSVEHCILCTFLDQDYSIYKNLLCE